MNIKPLLLPTLLLFTLLSHATTYYPAQIVGHELKEPFIEWVGHVGVTIGKDPYAPTEQIIEVLPTVNAIQINSLSDFKQRSQYWGSRYGIADQGPSAQHVIDEALRQRALCPTYTLTDSYHIGLGTPDNPIRCAVFRCDTFVTHIFHTAGHDLPTYHGITLPVRVFYAFPKAHHDYEAAERLSMSEFKAEVDLPKEQTTSQSIHSLWKLAQNPHLSVGKRFFILDYLGLNGTPDLIEEFIDSYKTETDERLRSMLVRSTFTLYQTHFLSQPHEPLRLFYEELLSKTLLPEEVPFVIRGFVNLSSTGQVFLSQYQLTQQLNRHQVTLPAETSLSLNLLLAFKSSALESYYLFRATQLLITAGSADLNQQFIDAVTARIKRIGPQALTPASAQMLQTQINFSG